MKIVAIGGTGLIGSKTVAILRQGGHEVVAGSPKRGVNTITGEGLKEAIAGAQVVIDLTNSPSFEDKAVNAASSPSRTKGHNLCLLAGGRPTAQRANRRITRLPTGLCLCRRTGRPRSSACGPGPTDGPHRTPFPGPRLPRCRRAGYRRRWTECPPLLGSVARSSIHGMARGS